MAAGGCLSPESTVTSLLSSSGHLRSSLLGPHATFRYRHKDYESASAALDAYIRDFERSRQPAGGLLLPGPPSTPSRAGAARNRDVLKERLTDRELDFLNLPVSSLHHRGNRERLSMTTDELLCIPHDGSMPVTHTSAFLRGLRSQSGSSEPGCSSRPAHMPWDPQRSPHPPPPPRSSRARPVDPRASRSLHLPRWFTSNETDMDCSGVSGVPERRYPAWVGTTATPAEERWDPRAPRTGPPSWVAALEEEEEEETPSRALQALGLQFAEQISLLAAERRGDDVTDTRRLFRGNRIESLIQKADRVLNSLSLSSGDLDGPADPVGVAEEAVSPVSSEELLPPRGPAAAAGGAAEAPPLRGAQAWVSGLHGNGLFKQPGPVEALKQMLFRLQAVEAELQRRQPAPGLSAGLQPRPDGEEQLERGHGGHGGHGGPSLQRAMHHLSRLKELVEEPTETQEEEEEEEEEGRSSSSPADGLVCTPLKPS